MVRIFNISWVGSQDNLKAGFVGSLFDPWSPMCVGAQGPLLLLLLLFVVFSQGNVWISPSLSPQMQTNLSSFLSQTFWGFTNLDWSQKHSTNKNMFLLLNHCHFFKKKWSGWRTRMRGREADELDVEGELEDDWGILVTVPLCPKKVSKISSREGGKPKMEHHGVNVQCPYDYVSIPFSGSDMQQIRYGRWRWQGLLRLQSSLAMVVKKNSQCRQCSNLVNFFSVLQEVRFHMLQTLTKSTRIAQENSQLIFISLSRFS